MKGFRNYTKICPLCGVEFKSHSRKRVYCSNSCRTQACVKRGEDFDPIAQNSYKQYLSQISSQNKALQSDEIFEGCRGIVRGVFKPQNETTELLCDILASYARVKMAGVPEEPKQITPLSYNQFKKELKRKIREYGKK